MKKSTIGMGILVAMVLTKASLHYFESSDSSDFARDEALASTLDESNQIREQHQIDFGSFLPQATLLASNFSAPELKYSEQAEVEIVSQRNENDPSDRFQNEENLLAFASNLNDIPEDEIIPMDQLSNTGYGLWQSSSDQLGSNSIEESKEEGDVPLDRGSTISESMTRLFPRNP